MDTRAIPIEQIKSFDPFVVRRRIAFRDCDPAGIVYTPRFFEPIATSAVDLFMSHLIGPHGDRDPEVAHLGTPAKAVQFEFNKTVPLGSLIDIEVSCDEIRNRTFSLKMVGRSDDASLLFSGLLTIICIDRTKFESISIPAHLKSKLTPFMQKATNS